MPRVSKQAMAGITTTSVQKAAAELHHMRRSLGRWLKYRTLNDQVMAGSAKTKVPLAVAQRIVASRRDVALEQDLADRLNALLSEVMSGVTLPNADLRSNPNAAVQLAQVAITGSVPITATAPAMSGVTATHPWLWPVLIVGGLLLAITTAIKSTADVAMQKEQDTCIEAGACTDYGFWLKAGGIAVVGWIAWRELGLGDFIRGLIAKRRS